MSDEKKLMNAYRMVYEDLAKNPLFMGRYDAKNGSETYMHGVACVMESIAFYADKSEEFDNLFLKNLIESEGRK